MWIILYILFCIPIDHSIHGKMKSTPYTKNYQRNTFIVCVYKIKSTECPSRYNQCNGLRILAKIYLRIGVTNQFSMCSTTEIYVCSHKFTLAFIFSHAQCIIIILNHFVRSGITKTGLVHTKNVFFCYMYFGFVNNLKSKCLESLDT